MARLENRRTPGPAPGHPEREGVISSHSRGGTMRNRFGVALLSIVLILAASAPGVCVAQTLETETSRLVPAGWWKVGTAFELQTSSEGREGAAPFLAEYGLTDHLELVLEPVPYTAIRPRTGRHATGPGDFEATLVYQFRQESRLVPALAMAAEIKVPTARDKLIGTKQTDYTGYFIASKRFGRIDVHANLAYTVPGSPPGAQLSNLTSYATALVFRPTPRWEIFGEVFGNTSSGPETADTCGAVAVVPEATGGGLVETAGAGRFVRPNLLLFLAVSHDNTGATQFRPGLTFKFPTNRAANAAGVK